MNKTDIAYAAGLIDGEGTITLTKQASGNEFRYPVISMSSTTHELVEFMQTIFSGNIIERNNRHPKWNKVWVWSVRGKNCLYMANLILPYLKEPNKIGRAGILVNEYKDLTIRNGKYDESQVLLKKDMERRFLALTSRKS